jgi:xylulokinase
MTANALAIDLGTTACKASVIAIDGAVLGSGLTRIPVVFGDDGAAEQDAEQVWVLTLDACRTAIAEAGTDAAASIVAVCVASQWSSIVPVDANGDPVSPLHMWFDGRGHDLVDALVPDQDGEAARCWADIHGFTPGTSLRHILWFQSQPDIHARTAAYLEPMDYLNARFTGVIAATANSAMPLGLTDNRRLGCSDWSPELIARAGVDRSRLPELTRSLSVLAPIRPEVADSLGIPRGVDVVTGANDSVAAAFGAGALEPGQAAMMMGTTGVLIAHHRARHVDPTRFIVTMPSALDDRYYVVAEGGLGGKLVELALAEVFGDDAVDGGAAFDKLSQAVDASPPGASGVLFLPWVFGSASPALDRRHRGAFLGLSLGTSSSDMARAMLEGISMQMRWLVDEVEQAIGVDFGAIRFVGGGAQSDVWASIMADVVGRTIVQLANPRHANARGAGFMAFVATGRLALDELDSLVPVKATFEPDAATADLYSERLEVVRDLHRVLAEPVSRLNR